METNVASDIRHVAIYLRISQEKKGENADTLLNHREILTSYATEKGWTYITYEEVLSGGKVDLNDRPQLQRLLNEIEKYDGVLVMELSRLSRNGLVSEQILQACVDYNKPILTREKTYDLANNQSDVLAYRFGALIASDEHARIGARSKNNKIALTKQGLHVTGNVPYGYVRNKDTKKLEINEEQAVVIRYIFKLHSQGLGSFRIRDILNEEGYRSAKGSHFIVESIKRIMENPVYRGAIVFNDRKRIKRNGKYVYINVDTFIVEGAHPAIIPPDEWYRANEMREERANKAKKVRERPAVKGGVSTLKDLMYCAKCKRKLSVRKDSKMVYFTVKTCDYLLKDGSKCHNAGIRADYVEELVQAELSTLRTQVEQEIVQLMNADTGSITAEINEEMLRVDKQLEQAETAFSKLIDYALAGVFTAQEIAGKKEELTSNINGLKTEKEALTVKLQNTNTASLEGKLRNVLSVLDDIEGSNVDPEELNAYYKRFIKRIYYSRLMPDDVRALSTRNAVRKNYPFTIEIEYM